METELKAEVKEEIQALEGRLVTQTKALKSSIDYLNSNDLVFHHDTNATSIPVSEDTIVAPPPPSSNLFFYALS